MYPPTQKPTHSTSTPHPYSLHEPVDSNLSLRAKYRLQSITSGRTRHQKPGALVTYTTVVTHTTVTHITVKGREQLS